MVKIEGLDKLSKDLDDASKVLAEMDGTIGKVSFDPDDPASIERAIKSVNMMIDEKVAGFEKNRIIAPMIEEMKVSYRAAILEKAAAARLAGSSDDE